MMFNLQVGISEGLVPPGRFLEHTDPGLRRRFEQDLSAVQRLPTLSMPEVGAPGAPQVAVVGQVRALRQMGRQYKFDFVPDDRFAPLPLTQIVQLADELDVDAWEFQRTHWAVKEVDLFEVLLAHVMKPSAAPSFEPYSDVRFPTSIPRDPELVAVMMPFDPSFDIVWETIQAAAAEVGLKAVRADLIWDKPHVMDDVLTLLWQARVVVADLTGKNPNVFYEIGLAHGQYRRTVLLTQNQDDIPFDLRSIRYLHYGVGTDDRAELREKLASRLAILASS